jgi:hypothetical protein
MAEGFVSMQPFYEDNVIKVNAQRVFPELGVIHEICQTGIKT